MTCPIRGSIDEALRLVRAFQFTKDAHGKVCLTNWKEGSKTIRADPLAKLNYFSAPAKGPYENGKANKNKHAHMDIKSMTIPDNLERIKFSYNS
ncbi:hypothetical protein H4582DRAFT_2101618 [Lactarius indigo]|nr:hypothetical protein H4582DRAFT_2101618 [Lactarius indigo]